MCAKGWGLNVIEATDICVSRGGNRILSDVSMTIDPGEFLCILGPNGAGKSTLLKVLCGEFQPDRGTVTLNGRSLSTYRPKELAARRGVLSQHTELAFSFTAAEVVSLANSNAQRSQRLEEWALGQVDLVEKFNQPYLTLSGGEKQRVHLARIFLQLRTHAVPDEPQFLILDEPTASLDPSFQQQVLKLARSAAKSGMGVLAVLHDLNEAMRFADRVGVLDDGNLVAEGRPETILSKDLVQNVYGVSVELVQRPDAAKPVVAFV